VDQIDSIFTFAFEELRAVAEAARAAGGRELHCLAWEFEMELALKKQAVEVETGLTIRLKVIPREIMEPNRSECQFFEAGYLEVKPFVWNAWNAQTPLAGREQGSRNPKVDVELVCFVPSLAEAPEKEMAALRERAIRSPFDFIDFWAVDFIVVRRQTLRAPLAGLPHPQEPLAEDAQRPRLGVRRRRQASGLREGDRRFWGGHHGGGGGQGVSPTRAYIAPRSLAGTSMRSSPSRRTVSLRRCSLQGLSP
jgi:hypothetical protein